MRIIIDRFEGDVAVIETQDKQMLNIPKALLPREAREGDVISIDIDRNETEKRSKRIASLMDNLWKD